MSKHSAAITCPVCGQQIERIDQELRPEQITPKDSKVRIDLPREWVAQPCGHVVKVTLTEEHVEIEAP